MNRLAIAFLVLASCRGPREQSEHVPPCDTTANVLMVVELPEEWGEEHGDE